MRSSCLCLAVLLVVPFADAAPAPDSSKQKLEALKKRLPEVLNEWVKENCDSWLVGKAVGVSERCCKPEVRVFRRIGSDRAKAVILFAAYVDKERARFQDIVLTAYLTYHDGCWTTERFEASSRRVDTKQLHPTFAFLMLAIDEAAEK